MTRNNTGQPGFTQLTWLKPNVKTVVLPLTTLITSAKQVGHVFAVVFHQLDYGKTIGMIFRKLGERVYERPIQF